MRYLTASMTTLSATAIAFFLSTFMDLIHGFAPNSSSGNDGSALSVKSVVVNSYMRELSQAVLADAEWLMY